MQELITVELARELIKEIVPSLSPKKMSLLESGGLTLAEDIFSNYHIPAFPQSGMDGYAFKWDANLSTYKIVGEMAAGSNDEPVLEHGHAVRIFTGAPVPQGADTVVMQEKATVVDNTLFIKDDKSTPGLNVRGIGTEISKGALALSNGTKLVPSAIGFLAAMGQDNVLAYPAPSVGIVVTGNELQQPGNSLGLGQVFDSNSFSLAAGLKELNIDDVQIYFAKDDLVALTHQLQQALINHDIVLLTGGVSVGDYDFTLRASEGAGVKSIFHKVRQKPGKPLFFGMHGKKVVFGMPGNPASVLTGFYEYVYLAISNLMQQDVSLKQIQVPLVNDFQKPLGLTHFLKAFYDGEFVTLLTGQESYKLGSFVKANCFAIFPENMLVAEKGKLIEIHLLPN